jgi:hypothetical protein
VTISICLLGKIAFDYLGNLFNIFYNIAIHCKTPNIIEYIKSFDIVDDGYEPVFVSVQDMIVDTYSESELELVSVSVQDLII